MANLSITYVRNPDVSLREEDEQGGLLFSPDTNQVEVINSTGVFLWSQCDGTHDLAYLLQALDEEFQHIPGEVEEDVIKFLAGLAEEGLLTVLPPKEA
jgi:hypothetical protein